MRSQRAWVRLARIISVAFIVFSAVGASPVAAYDARSGPVKVSVTAAGPNHALRIEARTTGGVLIYEIRAHVCLPGRNVRTSFDFGFEGRACPNVAIGGGDVDPSAAFPNGVTDGTLDHVRVGTGSTHWVNELGFPGSIQCDAGHPCDLVVRAQITNSTVFVTVPLCGSRPCRKPSSGSHRYGGVFWPLVLTSGVLLLGLWIAGTRRHRARVDAS